jgi:hypothetical protein
LIRASQRTLTSSILKRQTFLKDSHCREFAIDARVGAGTSYVVLVLGDADGVGFDGKRSPGSSPPPAVETGRSGAEGLVIARLQW